MTGSIESVVGVAGPLTLIFQIFMSVVLAIVLFAAAGTLKGWKRVAALIFGVLSVLSVIVGVIIFILSMLLLGVSG